MNKILKLIVVLISCICTPFPAVSAQYYVDNTCQYNGDGTTTDCAVSDGQAGAFHSLDDADGKSGGYSAGDIISLKRGQTYYETFVIPSSGTSGNPITINAYGTGDMPTISGELANPATYTWVVESANVFYVGSVNTDPGVIWRTVSDGHTYKMNKNTTSVATLMDLEWYYDSVNKRVYIKDLAGSSSPVDTIRILQRVGITASSKTNITIDGLKIVYASSGVQATTTTENWTIKNCEFGYATNYLVNLGTVKNTVFERNYAHDCAYAGTSALKFAGGASAGDALYFRYNLCIDMSSPVTTSDGTTPGSSYIYNNTFRNFVGNCLHAATTSSNAVIDQRNNIYVSCGYGSSSSPIYVSAGPTHTFDYNVWLPGGLGTTLDSDITVGAHCKRDDARYKIPLRYGIISFTEDNVTGGPIEEAINIAYARGVPMTYALSGTEWNNLSPSSQAAYATIIQDAVNNKKLELANHSNHHCTWGLMNGLAVQYVGSGTTASIAVSSSGTRLTATVDGSTDSNINNLDLTNAAYDTITELVSYIDGLADYTAVVKTSGTSSTASLKTSILQDANYADIKTASTNIVFDPTRYVAEEAIAWNNTIASDLGITPVTLMYPDTSPSSNSAVVTALATSGVFEAARSSTTGSYVLSTGIDLFYTDCSALLANQKTYYGFENSAADGINSQTLTLVNTSYANLGDGVAPYGRYVLEFTRANSSYAHRAVSAYWDMSGRDWLITLFIKPKDITEEQTIFSHGNDANNYCRLYLDTSGYVHFDVVASGSAVLQIVSSSAVTTSYFYRITLYQANNKWRMYLSTKTGTYVIGAPTKVADVLSTVTIPAYTGNPHFGAMYDGSTRSSFYNGYLDSVATEIGGWTSSINVYAIIADAGEFRTRLAHAETGMSRGIYIRMFDALEDFNGAPNSTTSGKVRAMSHHQAITHLKAISRLATDVRGGTNLLRYDIPYNTNALYDLENGSPAIYGGTDLSITGGDQRSIPLRNSTTPTIGCVEQYQKVY